MQSWICSSGKFQSKQTDSASPFAASRTIPAQPFIHPLLTRLQLLNEIYENIFPHPLKILIHGSLPILDSSLNVPQSIVGALVFYPPSQPEGRFWWTVGAALQRAPIAPCCSTVTFSSSDQTGTTDCHCSTFNQLTSRITESHIRTHVSECALHFASALLCLLKMYIVVWFCYFVAAVSVFVKCCQRTWRSQIVFFIFPLVGATTTWCKSFVQIVSNLSTETNPQCLMMIVEPLVVQTFYIVSKKKKSFYLFTLSFFSFSCLTLCYPVQMWTSWWGGYGRFWVLRSHLEFILWGTRAKKMCVCSHALYDGSQHTWL